MFRFKQFSISQQKSAMKVGTDGVLLGAWTPLKNEKSILDIGAGTGLVSLMLAQRTTTSNIDAVEIEENAFNEAVFNLENAPWSNRLKAFHASLESYSATCKYDLVVSNPPYFTDSFKENPSNRTLARHVGNLTFEKLLSITANLLTEYGACAFVIPFVEESNFVALAKTNGLYPKHITRVKGRIDVAVKRSLLYFTKEPLDCKVDELVIEIDRHVYTPAYIELTKEFYLKM